MVEPVPTGVLSCFFIFVAWLQGAGPAGAIVFGIAYATAILLCLPASLLTAMAGFVFGVGWGVLLSSPLALLAAATAYCAGRSVARPHVLRWVKRRPRSAALDIAMAKNGFQILLLLRLASVVPFAPLSYAIGASGMGLRAFILATWIGALPGTLFYVYVGSLIPSASELLSGERASVGGLEQAITWGAFVALLGAFIVTVVVARSALKSAIGEKLNHGQAV